MDWIFRASQRYTRDLSTMSRSGRSNVQLALICGLLACGLASAGSQDPAHRPEPKGRCDSPSFMEKGQCWTILKSNEDCLVQPIVVELEDQPLFCPRDKIMPASGKQDSGASRKP